MALAEVARETRESPVVQLLGDLHLLRILRMLKVNVEITQQHGQTPCMLYLECILDAFQRGEILIQGRYVASNHKVLFKSRFQVERQYSGSSHLKLIQLIERALLK